MTSSLREETRSAKTKRIRKGEHTKLARKCGRCGELRHNSRTCIRLGNSAGQGERARQWQQEQEHTDIIVKGLEQEVEAQIRREAGDDDVNMAYESELSQLQSSDFEGMDLDF
jgi:hypothetical protein